ncbi:ABC transporter ATP-binding protein [Methylibium rhizosphaerae]|uniref:ABC transporter ATP-binding protein n=1 Tax=Methylibium rhizosphaerae TaxID=2570323 RepID=UPI00112D5DF2|nr:ABC transporter ATP-binding protein [Methylibium rhizosphaerae]
MPAPDAPALLQLQHLDKRYASGTLALRDLSLAIGRHEFVSLLGPSGCGKSTVLRLLAGLDVPTAGQVQWAPHAQEMGLDVGFVFQEPTLLPWASVADNVALPLKLQRRRRVEIEALVGPALQAVGLADFAAAFPRELSGGMKMRVSLARALVARPSLLLLDEPFAALDEITRFRLNQDLLALWQRGFTGVFVTHSVYEAVFLSQRIVVMAPRPGRVVDEIAVDLPYPRNEATRHTPRYVELCVTVSRALQAASEQEAGQHA